MSITACSGGGTPPPGQSSSAPQSPSASSTPSTPSASPTPTASYKPADASGKAQNVPVPVLPEAAKAPTKAGLEAFARYWFEQLNFAYETGNSSGLDSVTSAGCEFCSNITRSLKTNYEGGRWLAGGHIETPSINTTYQAQSDGLYQIAVQVQQAKITYFDTGGKEFRPPTPPSDTGNVMLAAFKNGAWQLNALHPIR
ncbi:DUF6318 family protein [Arthrobacter sp. YAF34]|uniref:DUF6318 family protein n=1 Tax=Arthrobacter sp. YAF34 TaxID=3233083 RepID=UPI003F91AD39